MRIEQPLSLHAPNPHFETPQGGRFESVRGLPKSPANAGFCFRSPLLFFPMCTGMEQLLEQPDEKRFVFVVCKANELRRRGFC